jgi:hypothetical protein
MAIAVRTPYQSTRNKDAEDGDPGLVETLLSAAPVFRFLTNLQKREQLLVVDPATGERVCKLASVGGSFWSTIASSDGQTLATIVDTDPRYEFIACAYGGAGVLHTTQNLVIWKLPVSRLRR